MKEENKKEESVLIDLNDRKNIKIINASKKKVTTKDMQKFENKLLDRYNEYCKFTDLCIQKNREKNQELISNQLFIDAMESMLEENDFLENMIDNKKQKKQ